MCPQCLPPAAFTCAPNLAPTAPPSGVLQNFAESKIARLLVAAHDHGKMIAAEGNAVWDVRPSGCRKRRGRLQKQNSPHRFSLVKDNFVAVGVQNNGEATDGRLGNLLPKGHATFMQ